MGDSPDTTLRLRLRVALKLMAIAGFGAALAMAFVYATGGVPTLRDGEIKRVPVADLASGGARIVSWAGRPVIIVRLPDAGEAGGRDASDQWRVYYGTDPRHGCLLRWSGDASELRSRCADARYGVDGEPRGATRAPALRAPRHRITTDGVVVLGRE